MGIKAIEMLNLPSALLAASANTGARNFSASIIDIAYWNPFTTSHVLLKFIASQVIRSLSTSKAVQ